jgi:hypothetical protein
MSQNNSLSKKSGHPRFLFFMVAVMALWIATPFFIDLASTTHAQSGTGGLVAHLTGSPIADVTPHGSAFYSVAPFGTPPARSLFVGVSNVNLPAGTLLPVALNSTAIGTITLMQNTFDVGGRGTLLLSTGHGDTVPTVVAGDVLTVGGDVTYLSGTFAAPATPSPSGTHTPFPTPSHTPFPTPSHTPFPSPSGTPLPPHAFAARLNGANEVPPVTTNGIGIGFVGLNSAETQIRACVGFTHLSSAVTAITINGPASASENGPVIFTLPLPTSSFGFSSQTFDVTADQVTQLRGHLWYFQVATTNNPDGEIRGQLNPITPRYGGGFIGGGGGGNLSATQGSDDVESDSRSSYVPVPFDFDGDGITDIAVFHASDGNWYITRSSDGRTVAYQVDPE